MHQKFFLLTGVLLMESTCIFIVGGSTVSERDFSQFLPVTSMVDIYAPGLLMEPTYTDADGWWSSVSSRMIYL